MSPEMLELTLSEIGGNLAFFVVTTLVTCVMLRRDKVRRDKVRRLAGQ